MDPQRLVQTLKKVADGAARNQFHGQSLKALCLRGLIKRIYINDDNGPRIRYYRLTKAGRAHLRDLGQG